MRFGHECMGSQCSGFSLGVMWFLGLKSFIRRCRTEDKGCSVDEDRRERAELQ